MLVRGKYSERLRKGSNVVVLEPEVAEFFPDAASVNAALRALGEIAKRARAGPSVSWLLATETLVGDESGGPSDVAVHVWASVMLDRLLHHGHMLKCDPRSWCAKTPTSPTG